MKIKKNTKYILNNGKDAYTKDVTNVLYVVEDAEEKAFDIDIAGIPIYQSMIDLGYSIDKEKELFSVNITGFESKEEAQAFIDWYSGQGEQDSEFWFECRQDEGEIKHSKMLVDSKTYPLKWNENSVEMKMEFFV